MTRARVAAVLGAAIALASPHHLLTALAAEPTPSPLGGDPRSAGEGPGLVGDPLFAIGAVVLIAVAAVVLTTVWVRATAGRERPGGRPPR